MAETISAEFFGSSRSKTVFGWPLLIGNRKLGLRRSSLPYLPKIDSSSDPLQVDNGLRSCNGLGFPLKGTKADDDGVRNMRRPFRNRPPRVS